jgi:hypothetical protein
MAFPEKSLLADGQEPSVIAAELKARFEGAKLCSDSQDGFWLDTFFKAAGIECSFTLLPVGSLVGRSTADEIYRMTLARRSLWALPDATSTMAATIRLEGEMSTTKRRYSQSLRSVRRCRKSMTSRAG